MKKIEYEKKEKVIHYCINWGNDCASSEKEYSKVSRPRKECKFCLQRKADERNRKKQLDRYKETQEELLRLSEIEESQKEFKDTPVRLGKMFSEEELERERLRVERKEARQIEKKKKPVKRIKSTSIKESKLREEYRKVIKEIDETRPMICAGCERSDLPLSHSHRIRVSLRKDLMTDPNNIDLMCFGFSGSCHDKVESFEWDSLRNKDKIIEYVKENEPSQYWLYFYKNRVA